jgi:RNA polymerase sigma-70 factor (ECF subfamily)
MIDKNVGPAPRLADNRGPGGVPIEIGVLSSDELGRLFDEYRTYLLAIALEELPEALRGKLGASDLVQETIVRGFEFAGTFQGKSKEELAGWLRSILLNLLANIIKSYRAEKRDIARECVANSRLEHPEQLSPSALALSREQWDLLQDALARLPANFRQVILLRHRENLTFVEVGERLGKSEDAVAKLWSRAIRQLKQELRPHESRRS